MTIKGNFFKTENVPKFQDSIGLTKEQILLNDLKQIAHEYLEIEDLKKKFVDIILKNLKDLDLSELLKYPNYDIKENLIKNAVFPANIRGLNVVSVDGSSVLKKFMNIDLSFLKAIAVKYHFYQNDSSKIDYFPDISGYNNYKVQGTYVNREESEVETTVSMDMTYMELNLLNNLISKNSDIDLIILDGSIVIMPINYIFSKDIELSRRYDILLKEYEKLYYNCKENGIILIGSIKDTRTSALTNTLRSSIQMLKPSTTRLHDFLNINYRQLMEYFSDLDLFSRILNKSERSCIFNCKREVDKIRDTGIKKEIPYYFPFNFYAFYLKTALHDSPCRFEFFMDYKSSNKEATEKADLISSILLPISSLNEFYGLPIPQVEAHRRAAFKPQEFGLLFNNLTRTLSKNGIFLKEKRRMRRPF
ncbi:MAG: DNA double-strand break repair nuclease NurA [Candidatus Thorarchaeota archaeon]